MFFKGHDDVFSKREYTITEIVFYNSDSSSSGKLSIPVRHEAFWKELDYVKHLWKHRQELKVEDAGIAALFGLECFAWYCAGEIVGRGFTFTGYYV
ncbi:ATP SYNTHASE SUBUNIT [Salix koriyanagi]|uniref:ATP SYNTHASE SUBUNIT n=1 Tax=Salix koriyanagi TaxID=2511006 RepID=A0A9Q0VBW3_9ROSI|nr:ATP SYNTHASE SUBUNIT [Salix koriyanagi]